jgi:hypothetical protein
LLSFGPDSQRRAFGSAQAAFGCGHCDVRNGEGGGGVRGRDAIERGWQVGEEMKVASLKGGFDF